MPRLAARTALALLLAAPTLATAAPATTDPGPVVAQRGSASLTAGAVRDMLASLDPDAQAKLRADPQALAAFIRDRMLQTALLDEARATGWDQRPDIAARAEQARNAAIADSYLAAQSQPDPAFPTDADLQSAYDANKAKLMVPRQYHLAQLFIPLPAGTPQAAEDEARSRLAALRSQWLRDKSDAAAALKKAADDKRPAATGADLGWLREDQIAPAIRPAVTGLAEGAASDPIRLADGWHVLRLTQTRPAAPATLAETRDALTRALRQARQQQAARAYLDALLQKTPVQLNEIELGRIAGK